MDESPYWHLRVCASVLLLTDNHQSFYNGTERKTLPTYREKRKPLPTYRANRNLYPLMEQAEIPIVDVKFFFFVFRYHLHVQWSILQWQQKASFFWVSLNSKLVCPHLSCFTFLYNPQTVCLLSTQFVEAEEYKQRHRMRKWFNISRDAERGNDSINKRHDI